MMNCFLWCSLLQVNWFFVPINRSNFIRIGGCTNVLLHFDWYFWWVILFLVGLWFAITRWWFSKSLRSNSLVDLWCSRKYCMVEVYLRGVNQSEQKEIVYALLCHPHTLWIHWKESTGPLWEFFMRDAW
jgi:hypothetical protein